MDEFTRTILAITAGAIVEGAFIGLAIWMMIQDHREAKRKKLRRSGKTNRH